MINPVSEQLPSTTTNVVTDSTRYQADQYENPYYLHDSGNPGLVPISDRLTTTS